MNSHTFSAVTLFFLLLLVGCGSSSSDSGSDGGSTTPPVTSTDTKNFIIEPSSAAGILPSLNASRNADGTVYFSGKVGVQRVSGTQSIDIAPPARLSVRFVNVATGISFGTDGVPRGPFASGDTLDGSSNHNGVWYYTFYDNLGYSVPTGTAIRAEIIDDAFDTVGDELQANGYSFWTNVPLAPASNSAPIPFHTFSVPGPG